jgi:4a-hydroxytetrahydrobiopterin dehydratase
LKIAIFKVVRGNSGLADKQCVPCRGGVPALRPDVQKELLRELDTGWRTVDGHHLERDFTFRNFRQAMELANEVARIAEEQRHHPELHVGWGKLKVTLFTNTIDGLHENDFILAARIDARCRLLGLSD